MAGQSLDNISLDLILVRPIYYGLPVCNTIMRPTRLVLLMVVDPSIEAALFPGIPLDSARV